MQVELEDDRAVPRQVLFERVDVFEALVPDLLRDKRGRQLLRLEVLRVDAYRDDFLVVRTVEDADAPALGQDFRRAPEEIVIQLLA